MTKMTEDEMSAYVKGMLDTEEYMTNEAADAYNAGYEKGRKVGFAEGRELVFDGAWLDGHSKGYEKGFQDGYDTGAEDAL